MTMRTLERHEVDRPTAAPARVALIGLGGSAERILLPGLARVSGARVAAGCDLDARARDRAAARWKIPRVYSSPEEMLREERPDVAIVATPPLTHAELCLLALDHGCHVFCEKPFVSSLEEADRVVAAAERARRRVAVNNQYYQMPIYRAVRRFLEGGEPGRLYYIDVWQHMHLLPADEGGWKAALQPRRVLYEFGTHALDLICQFFGAYPVAVSAVTPRVHPEIDADVLVVMRLDFPGDRVANMVLNRASHAPKRYLEMRMDCERGSIRTSLGGVARFQLGWNSVRRRPKVRVGLSSGGETWWERDGGAQILMRQPYRVFSQAAAEHFEAFLVAIQADREPPVSARHAREVLRAVLAGYGSAAQSGERVPV